MFHRFHLSIAALSSLFAFVSVQPLEAQLPSCGVAGKFEIDGDPFCDADGRIDWCPAEPNLPPTSCQVVFGGRLSTILGVRAHKQDGNFGLPLTEVNIFDGGSNKNTDLIGLGQDPWTVKDGGGFPQRNDITDATIYTFIDDSGYRWIVFSMATRTLSEATLLDIEFNHAGLSVIPDPSGAADSLVVGNGPYGGRTPIDPGTGRPRDFVLSVDFNVTGTVDRADLFVWQDIGGSFQYGPPPSGTVDATNTFICVNTPVSQPPTGAVSKPCWGAIGPDGLAATQYLSQQWEELAVNLSAFGFSDSVLEASGSTFIFKTRSSPAFTAELKDFLIIPFSFVRATTGVPDRLDHGELRPLRVHPNPARARDVVSIEVEVPPAPGNVSRNLCVEVYDVGGRRIRTVFCGPMTGGTHQFEWDQTTQEGAKFAGGVAFIRTELDNRRLGSNRIVILNR